MEKIQENFEPKKQSKTFIIGVVLILSSSAIGWIIVFLCAGLAVKFGRHWIKIGSIIYALTWIPFLLGFIFAGKQGIQYSKKIYRRIFRCGK